MLKITDSKHTFGAFIPLPGLGTRQPLPKVLAFVCRNGYTYCTNYQAINGPLADTCSSLYPAHVACGRGVDPAANDSIHTSASRQITAGPAELTYEPIAGTATGDEINFEPAQLVPPLAWPRSGGNANEAGASDEDGGDTGDDEDWHLEGLDALRRASRPTVAAKAAAQQTETSKEKPSSWRRDSVISSSSMQCDDEHGDTASSAHLDSSKQAAGNQELLMRALQSSLNDDAAMARFRAECAPHVGGPLSYLAEYPAMKVAIETATDHLREGSPDVLMADLSHFTVKPHSSAKKKAAPGEKKGGRLSRLLQSASQSKITYGNIAATRTEKGQVSHKRWRQKRK